MRAEITAIEMLFAPNGLLRQHDPVDKGRTQRAGIAALVAVWWQTVRQDVTQLAMTPRWTRWAEDVLLPLMSWHEQRRRTRRAVANDKTVMLGFAVCDHQVFSWFDLPDRKQFPLIPSENLCRIGDGFHNLRL